MILRFDSILCLGLPCLITSSNFDNFFEANAMVGGDNAARAVAIGLVLGAFHGVNAIPQEQTEHDRGPTPRFETLQRVVYGERNCASNS